MSDIFLQPAVSLVMLYGGLVLGVLYAVFRMLRSAYRTRLCTALCDLLFVGCSASVTAYCLLLTTKGELRAFAFLFLFLGFFLARYVFCSLVAASFKKRYK